MLKKFRTARGVAPVCALLVLAACDDDGTTPSETGFDPAFAAEALAALRQPFDATALESRVGLVTFALAQALAGNALPDYMGRTLVFDPQDLRYEVDGSRTGAPASAVRFVAYEMNAAAGSPRFPLREVGYIDVTIDDDTPATTALELTYVGTAGGGTETLAQHATAVTITDDAAGWQRVLASSGFSSDGADRVDFDLAMSHAVPAGAAVGSFSQSIALESEDGSLAFGQTVEMDYDLDSYASVGDAAHVTTVTAGAETLVIDLVVDEEDDLEGVVRRGQETVLGVTGTFLSPVYRLPTGAPAGSATQAAMAGIWETVQELAGLAVRMTGPADVVARED